MSNLKDKLAKIDRRTFLTGSLNTLVGLPVLDFMLNSSGTAFAQNVAIPKRFFMMTNGNALMNDKVNPKKVGKDYDLPHALKVLENYPHLRNKFSVVSNLGMNYRKATKVKYGPGLGPDRNAFHHESMVVQLTGRTARSAHNARSASADYLLRKYFKTSASHEHFSACVCLSAYGNNNGLDSRAAHQFNDNGGRERGEYNILNYYNKLTQKIKGADPKVEQARIKALKDKKSVLDFIEKRKLAYLNNLVSSNAKQKISDHLDHMRDIEKSIVSDMEKGQAQACEKIGKPKDYSRVDNVNDYSNEYERSLIFVDLMAMAIKCDLSRYGTLVITPTQNMINHDKIKKLYGVNTSANSREKDYHGNTHNTNVAKDLNHDIWLELSAVYRWHIDVMLRLADKLSKEKEGANSLLDNTVLFMPSEGGWGPMSFSSGNGTFNGPHSCDNMTQMYITGLKELKQGEHIRMATPRHASEAILTAMRAIGYKGNLGDITRSITEMEG